MPYEEACTFMRRYLGFLMVWCFLRGRDKVERSREAVGATAGAGARGRGRERGAPPRTYGQELYDEYHAYYAKYPATRAGEIVDPVRDAQEQRWRKADWRAKQARQKKERARAAAEAQA